MRSLLRVGRIIAAGLGLILLLAIIAAGAAGWRTLPPRAQTLQVPGLSQPVAITIDQYGVPRIEAARADDAAAALGFLHARDRMFQMELMRRAGSGRISEIAGAAALRYDRMMRVMGLRVRAEAAYAALPPADRSALDAYARGVNAEIAARGRFIAPEFVLTGPPAPWTAIDTLLWGRLMALELGGNWRTELARLAASPRMPLDRQLALQPPGARGVLAPEAMLQDRGLSRLAARLEQALPRFPSPWMHPEEASDEWAVDGAHSMTGAPLLAGDPHLELSFPAVWYLARIDYPGFSLAGVTAPGAPFLVIGQNGHIAWTFTSNEADTQDLFIEHPGPGDTTLSSQGPQAIIHRREIIHVRGGPDDVLDIRETAHGPLISDALADSGLHGQMLALSMEALAPTTPAHGDAASSLFALDRATTIEQAGAAAAASIAPVQNLLVADRTRIAQFSTGLVPVRRSGDGSFPQDGADGAHDWIGAASGAQLPHVIAPASGHLLNGNERTAAPDFPVYMGRDWPDDWRARRIRTLLEARPRHDIGDFAAMQNDPRSAFAQAMLPDLQSRMQTITQSAFPARALALLRGWDGSMSADAPQPLIFNAWLQRFASDMFERRHIDPALTGPWPDFVAFLLSPDGRTLCGEDCNARLAQALDAATGQVAASQGNDPAAWRWSRAHRAVFANPFLGALPLLGRLATRHVAVSGDETTLLRSGGMLGSFDAIHGGAYRGVYDLADPERSRFIVTPGQSGNWLSPDAWNLMQTWASGATISIARQPRTITATASLTP